MKHQCHKRVTKGEFGRAVPCSRPGTVADDKVPDRWWCATHSPAGVEERRARRERNHQQWTAQRALQRAIFDWNASCVDFVVKVANGTITAPRAHAQMLLEKRPIQIGEVS